MLYAFYFKIQAIQNFIKRNLKNELEKKHVMLVHITDDFEKYKIQSRHQIIPDICFYFRNSA